MNYILQKYLHVLRMIERLTWQWELLAHPKLAKHSVHIVRLDKNIKNQTLLRVPEELVMVAKHRQT